MKGDKITAYKCDACGCVRNYENEQKSPTPRTDAEVVICEHRYQRLYPTFNRYPVEADFARSLERENTALKELLRQIRDNEVNAQDEADKFLRDHVPSELSNVKAELAAAREDREVFQILSDNRWQQVGYKVNELAESEHKREEAVALLRELEWSSGGVGCPCCGNNCISEYHHADCKLAAIIGGKDMTGGGE